MLGDKVIEVDPHGNITLGNHSFKGTPGLWEMIMERNPRVNDIPMVDVENYEELAEFDNIIVETLS